MERFTTSLEKLETKPGCWNYLKVTILDNGKEIGSYIRTYSSMLNTFYPFEQDGEWYALYSKDYTATRVMKLPECLDLCGEEPKSNGFCPTDFYVPFGEDFEDSDYDEIRGKIGFVAGCVWGDDWSWKIQFLDLSKIKDGIFKREERFGYYPLPRDLSLKDCIDFSFYEDKNYPYVGLIKFPEAYNINTGEKRK